MESQLCKLAHGAEVNKIRGQKIDDPGQMQLRQPWKLKQYRVLAITMEYMEARPGNAEPQIRRVFHASRQAQSCKGGIQNHGGLGNHQSDFPHSSLLHICTADVRKLAAMLGLQASYSCLDR